MAPTEPQPVKESNARWWCPLTHLKHLWKKACNAEAEIQAKDQARFQAQLAMDRWRAARGNANEAHADSESASEPRITEQERLEVYETLISHLNRQPRVYSLASSKNQELADASSSPSSVAAAPKPSGPEQRSSPRTPSPRQESASASLLSCSSSSSSSSSSVTGPRPSRPLFFWQKPGLLAPPVPEEPDYEGEDTFAGFDGVFYQGD